MKLTRAQRRAAEKAGRAEQRDGGTIIDVQLAVENHLFEREADYGLSDHPATEISDYGWSLARFVCPREAE